MDQTVKLCVQCRYYVKGDCYAPENMTTDFVNCGKRTRQSVHYLRAEDGKCGNEGKWYEDKAAA